MFGRRRSERQAARERQAVDAAAAYVLAGISGDDDRLADAATGVDPSALPAGLAVIAERAVAALARERGVSVDEVMTSLTSGEPDGQT